MINLFVVNGAKDATLLTAMRWGDPFPSLHHLKRFIWAGYHKNNSLQIPYTLSPTLFLNFQRPHTSKQANRQTNKRKFPFKTVVNYTQMFKFAVTRNLSADLLSS